MHDGAKARRSIMVLAWVGLQKRNEFPQILRWQLGIDGKNLAYSADLGDGREACAHVQFHTRIKKLIEYRRRNRVHDQRIAVWRRTRGGFRAERAAGTATIVDE